MVYLFEDIEAQNWDNVLLFEKYTYFDLSWERKILETFQGQ